MTDLPASDTAFPEGLPDPVALRAKIAQQVEDAQSHAAAINAMNERLTRLEATASSPGGDVRVTVNAKCMTTSLELGEHTIRLGRRALAKLILDTTAEAQRSVARQALAIAEGTLGDTTIAQLRAEYESQLGYIDDDSPADPNAAAGRAASTIAGRIPGVTWNR